MQIALSKFLKTPVKECCLGEKNTKLFQRMYKAKRKDTVFEQPMI